MSDRAQAIALVEDALLALDHPNAAAGEVAAHVVDALLGDTAEHVYVSTGCRHGEHAYCASMTGMQGAKRPAVCKFCEAPCRCRCHGPAFDRSALIDWAALDDDDTPRTPPRAD